MDLDDPECPTDAPPPFDRPDADIILRSSDNVDFHVLKCILSLVSPFFSTMFTLPQRAKKTSAAKIIHLSEDSHILGILLGYCYHQEHLDILTIDETVRTWELCRKYEMTGIEMHVRKELVQQLSEEEPLRAFALATRYGLADEAQVAARRSLAMSPLERPYIPELEDITAGQYHRLLQYHHACAQKALAVTQGPYVWITSESFVWFVHHITGKCEIVNVKLGMASHSRVSSRWWVDYMQACGISLVKKPVKSTISMTSEETGLALEKTHQCPTCRPKAYKDMVKFVKLFSTEVDRAISEVQLDLTL